MKNSLLKRIVVYICAVFLAAILVFGSLSCIDNIQRTTRLTTNIAKSASYIVSQIASDYDMEGLLIIRHPKGIVIYSQALEAYV